MIACRAGALLGLLLVPTAALAQELPPPLAGRNLLAGCRQGECSWLRVTRLERVSGTAAGELRRLVAREGHSVYGAGEDAPTIYRIRIPIAWDAVDSEYYVFCSRRQPAYVFQSEGGYIAHYLDLFDLAGYQQASATVYMRACHDLPLTSAARLRRLGYRPGTRNEQVEGARPEDLAR